MPSAIKDQNHDPHQPKKKKYSLEALSKEFADSTSLHGMKFITQENAFKAERIMWAVLCFLGFMFAMVWSWRLWDNWHLYPVLTTVQSANVAINTRYFPAVTICSVNKISTKYLDKWMETNPEAKIFRLDEIRRIIGIIQTNRVENENEMVVLSSLLNKANINSNKRGYERLASAVAPKCSDLIVYCTWESKEENCTSIIGLETTDDGYCCSFNSFIATKDGSVQSGKEIMYGKTRGVYAGFSVILNAKLEDYNLTSSSSNGFKVSIQAPEDIPATGSIGFLASPGTQVDVAVTGQMQVADDESMKVIDQKYRMCATENEIKLKYFNEYTKQYCHMDCFSRTFIANCRCIPYYYPISDSVLPSCNISAYICIEKNMQQLVSNSSACNCPELCNSVWYSAEISRGTYPNPVAEFPRAIKKRSEFVNMTQEEFDTYAKKNFVKLNVYLKSVTGMGYIMDHRTTWADFISATGGLLVLGFGFSLLGGAEFLYFYLIRWVYHWYQEKKELERSTHQISTIEGYAVSESDLTSPSRPYKSNAWASPESKRPKLLYRQKN